MMDAVQRLRVAGISSGHWRSSTRRSWQLSRKPTQTRTGRVPEVQLSEMRSIERGEPLDKVHGTVASTEESTTVTTPTPGQKRITDNLIVNESNRLMRLPRMGV